jgi:membrane-associated phospholipid phosphatase
MPSPKQKFAKPLLKLDKQALDFFRPYRHSAPVRALDWVAKVADQPQLRTLCGVLFAAGAVRADARLMRAATRMLVAHELANTAKNVIKLRIDRRRPRSHEGDKAPKPRKGRHTAKEMTSFPSGHSGGSMAVACAFAAEYPRYGPAAIAASAALGASRIPPAAHNPSDVAAGLVIGAGASAVLTLAARGLRAVVRAALRRGTQA